MAVGLVPIARARRRAVTPSTPWARYRRRAARRMDVRRSQTRREERPGEGLRLVNTVNQAMAPIDAPSQAPPGRRRSGGRSATDEAGALVDVQAARTLAAVVVADLRALARRCERSGEAEAQRDQGSGRRWIGPVASGDREAHDARLVRVQLEDDALDAARRVLGAALELPGIDAPVPPPDLGRGVEGHRGQRDVDGGIPEPVDQLDQQAGLRRIERGHLVDVGGAADLDPLVTGGLAELPEADLGALDVDVGNRRARIAQVAEAVPVGVDLEGIDDRRTVVVGVAHGVPVLVGDVEVV